MFKIKMQMLMSIHFGGRRGEAMNELMKDYALNYIMSKRRENHPLNNEGLYSRFRLVCSWYA